MIVYNGTKVFILKGKYKGKIGTVLCRSEFGGGYYEIELNNVLDKNDNPIKKWYHMTSFDHVQA